MNKAQQLIESLERELPDTPKLSKSVDRITRHPKDFQSVIIKAVNDLVGFKKRAESVGMKKNLTETKTYLRAKQELKSTMKNWSKDIDSMFSEFMDNI